MNALIILSLLGILTLFAGIFNLKNRSILLAVVGLLGALFLNVQEWNLNQSHYNDMVLFDNYALAFSSLMIVSTAIVLLMAYQFYKKTESNTVDLYALKIFSLVGAICLVSYNHLAVLFIGIEILSIPLYILAGSQRSDIRSNEAGMKYFLMGAFTSAFLLMGIALIFVSTGSFHLNEIKQALGSLGSQDSALLLTGILFVLAGFLFKVAAVPFHFWAPDVYEGAPTISTALMSTVVKTAAFAALFKLFTYTLSSFESVWYNALWAICAITLISGNIIALYQSGLKRLLAYSSIAHAGYMLLAILTLNQHAADALFFYSAAYSVSSLLTFAIIIAIAGQDGTVKMESLQGIGRKHPFLGFALSVGLLSLAGIPPMAGFMGKFYLFKTAVDVNLIYITLIAVIASIIGAYYYVRTVSGFYVSQAHPEKIPVKMGLTIAASVSLIGVLLLGLYPNILMNLLQ